jgi:hypothetical protein
MNEEHVPIIQKALPDHKVIYIGSTKGFTLSGIPLGSDQFITTALVQPFPIITLIIDVFIIT